MSRADWKRSSGRFSRQRFTTRSSPGETSGFASSGDSSLRIAVIISTVLPPVNGCFPESISWNTAPNEKMSDLWSAGSPLTCSGDM